MVPVGDTQPLVAVVVLAPSTGAGPWPGVPGLDGACRGLQARVGRSNSVAGPGELAEGRLPVWGSAEPAVRVWGRVVGPIRVGRPAPPATVVRHRLGAGSRGLPGRRASESNCWTDRLPAGRRAVDAEWEQKHSAQPTEPIHPGEGPRPSPGSPYA